MVANALECLGDEDQFDCAGNRARIFQHVRQKLPENLFVEVIEDVVIKYYLFCKLRIGIDERIEAFFKDLLRCFRHDRQIDQPFEFRFLDQFRRSLADINGNIADALDVFDNFHGRRNKAQVACDRLFEREDLVAQLIDFNFQLVDLIIPADDFFGETRTPFDQRADRILRSSAQLYDS